MYIPSFNKFPDQEVLAFMKRYSFATIISVKNELPVATHLPFLVKERDNKIILTSHFAKANPQSSDIIGTTALVIFTEPHAYISPKHYEKIEVCQPGTTWRYMLMANALYWTANKIKPLYCRK